MTGSLVKSAILAATIAAAGPVSAQSILGDPSTLLADADRNRDGSITRAEFIAARARSFDTVDTNRDGSLSVTEVAAVVPGSLERMAVRLNFGQFDQNRDGRLARAEMNAGPTFAFDRVDADRDGVISAGELAAWQSRAR